MIEGVQTKDIEQIYDEMIDAYTKGDYLEGITQWGDYSSQVGNRRMVPRAFTPPRK